MSGRLEPRRRSFLSYAGIALYAAVVIVSSFQHHDLICHLKSPQHCNACTSNQPGTGAHSPSLGSAYGLTDAGRPHVAAPVGRRLLLTVRSSGRSPPADSFETF
jgi:hypothetical protein